MSERMTSVRLDGEGRGMFAAGFADYGRRDPAEMIERLRKIARTERDHAQRILDAADDDFIVETYVGVHVRRNGERLWPAESARVPNHADRSQG